MEPLRLKDHLEKLYPFKVVADVGGITAASKVLGLNQSSLSHTLKSLEGILELTLFTRHSRGVSLTAEGLILYEFSKRIFHQADHIELKLKSLGHDPSSFGILKVATHETLAIHIWPDLFRRMSVKFPRLQISLMSGRIDSIVQDLLNRNVDIALTVEPSAHPKLVRIPIYSGAFAFYASFQEKRVSLTLEELERETLLTDSYAHLRQGIPILQYLKLAGIQARHVLTLNSFEAAMSLAGAGVGICVIPKQTSKRAVAEKKIREIQVAGLGDDFFGCYTIHASYLKSSQNKMIEPFIAELAQVRD